MAHQLMTQTEVDALLDPDVYPEWDALEPPFKDFYIEQASNYVLLNWIYYNAVEFDWLLQGTWPSHTDDGVAQYCNAAALSYLYPRPATGVDSEAPIKKKTSKAGSLEQTIEYAQDDLPGDGPSQLKAVEDLFLAIGFKRVSANAPGSLTRV